MLGYGPIERFLEDETVTEIMVNGPDEIYVERGGRIYPADVRVHRRGAPAPIIDKIVRAVGRRIDESSPMVDARLPDGSASTRSSRRCRSTGRR